MIEGEKEKNALGELAESPRPAPRVAKRSSLDAGGCSACDERTFSVFELSFKNTTVRVCYACASGLMRALRSATHI